MKVLILGGGPAGCAAAYFLKKKGVSNITIIEEREIGGCVRTKFYQKIPYEFGPQIMYTDEPRLQQVFEEFVTQHKPPSQDGKYHPGLSVDGMLENGSIHDFPITIQNVLRFPEPEQIIFELYNVNLEKPDFSSFENYVIARIGKTLYDMYVKNYNIKQWKIHPKDMDAEWARFRNLTLKPKSSGMFGDKWQGHPGNFNPMWDGMTKNVRIIKGKATISEDLRRVTINGEEIVGDMIISTIPLSERLEFINTTKVYVAVKSEAFVLPNYIVSFPNNYNFTRIMEYKQQFYVDSEYSLLDYAFPWVDGCRENAYVEEASSFTTSVLRKEIEDIWCNTRTHIYPVSTKRNLDIIDEKIDNIAYTNIIPMGRMGIHAYVSKDTCIRMGFIMSDNWDVFLNGSPDEKKKVLRKMREKLT